MQLKRSHTCLSCLYRECTVIGATAVTNEYHFRAGYICTQLIEFTPIIRLDEIKICIFINSNNADTYLSGTYATWNCA